eukprot:12890_1
MAATLATESVEVHPHSLLSPQQLKRITFENGCVCRVVGFPSFITEPILTSKPCYGQFKGLSRVWLQRCGKTQKISAAYLTFDNEFSAQQAIDFSNSSMLEDGTRLRASLAWNKYCSLFIQKEKCSYHSSCPHRHEWGRLIDVVGPHKRAQAQRPINITQPALFVLNLPLSASDDRLTRIKKQIEYYFSVDNMNNDDFLRRAMNDEGWIEIDIIVQCNRMRQLKATKQDIREIAKISENIECAQNKDAVRMIHWKAYIPCSELQTKYDELKLQFESTRDYNTQIQREYARLREMYNQLLNQQHLTENELKKVQNENKELATRYNELLQNNNRREDYRLWTAKDLVHWIINLDELRYTQYAQSLMSNLVKEEIDGSCLKDLEKNDLHRFGITKFKDKRDIHQSIQELVSEHNQKEGMDDHKTPFV